MFNFGEVRENNVMAPSKRREGCELIGVKRDTENNSMIFEFREKATGGTLSHREFIPSRMEGQDDDKFKQSIQMNVSRIAHIYRAFATEAEFLAVKVDDPNNLAKAGENWVTITKIVGKSLKEKIEAKQDMTCALKVTLRENKGKYYSALPMVPPFISTTNHPKEFTVNPQFDKFEAPTFVPDPAKGTPSQQNAGQQPSNQAAGNTASAFTGAAGKDDPDF